MAYKSVNLIERVIEGNNPPLFNLTNEIQKSTLEDQWATKSCTEEVSIAETPFITTRRCIQHVKTNIIVFNSLMDCCKFLSKQRREIVIN